MCPAAPHRGDQREQGACPHGAGLQLVLHRLPLQRGHDGPHRHGENVPVLPASDWSVMRIYPRFLRLIGPS
eukprot:7897951-Pyramimonas_sp.AAC.3